MTEWREFERLEPFGETRADLRSALVGAKIVAALTGQPQKLEDFMPAFAEEETDEEMEEAAQRSNLERMAIALGAEVIRHDA